MTEVHQENNQELIVDFVDEAIDSLRSLPDHLDAFRQNANDAEAINAVFRPVHSIKGCAGFLGLTGIKVFSHSLENTLDEVRKQKLVLSEELQRLLVGGLDLLESRLQRAEDGDIDDELGDDERQQLENIARVAAQCRLERTPEEELLDQILQLADEIAQSELPSAGELAHRARGLVESYHDGQPPPSEENEETSSAPSRPVAEDFAGATLRCGDEDVSAQVAALLEVFLAASQNNYTDQHGTDFLCRGEQFADWAESAKQPALAEAVRKALVDFKTIYDSPLDVDASLLDLVWDHLWPELSQLDGAPSVVGDNASPEEDNTSSTISDKAAGSAKGNKDSSPKSGKSRMVRIKEEQVDSFLNDVSNLFITAELLKDVHARMVHDGAMRALVEELRQINGAFNAQSNALQQSVVALRRVEIRSLFSKFPRMARTLANQLNKKIDVHVIGEDIEVDKSLIEALDAPLAHMIRNACDHGIETPNERLARGVSETGNLTLKAELTRTHVVITIQDDGKGIDAEKLLRKAVEKGIYTSEEADALSDEQALRLVFHAGLSTADKLSDVSGRGVGMDVVRSNLAEHNGEIYVESQPGVGSTVRLEIPIRDAVLVIDGLMLQQADSDFVLPFEYILEIAEIGSDCLKPVQGSWVVTIRNDTYAAVSMGDLLGLPHEHFESGQPMTAVLVGCKAGEVCLLVDRVCGHRQVVVNSISDVLPGTDKTAGVAQLGGGHLALVLSVEDLVKSLTKVAVTC